MLLYSFPLPIAAYGMSCLTDNCHDDCGAMIGRIDDLYILTLTMVSRTLLRWMPDELASSAFCRLGELRTVPVTEYDNRFDLWTIDAELSTGCGGPEIVEEIMH